MKFNLDAAQRHIHLLAGESDPLVAWQVFDDTKQQPNLARGFHGRLDDVLPRLTKAQETGCGVFVAVNATDGKRRRIENMVHARAVFLDLDGAPLPDIWPVEPDLVIHSSSVDGVDRYQCWWLIDPTVDWTTWRQTQKAMALRYGGDLKCSLVTQVGRCAGFWHQKRPDQPWQVSIIHDGAIDESVRWPLDKLVKRFGFDLSAITVPSGRREQIDRPPPMYGWDNILDVVAARRLVADEANWKTTSNGAVSVFQMAARLRDLGISQGLAIELIEETVPVLPAEAESDNRYVERKVGNAYAYAQNDAGAWSHEADRQELIGKLVDRDALSTFLDNGDDDE
jgi:hypothetical protein